MIVYTIGHSNLSADRLIELLRKHEITAVADVRSQPYSRINPQFNRETINNTLSETGIAYAFLGAELGARSEDPACYEDGKVSYDRLAATDLFQQGLDRVAKGASEHRLALMCAEREPLDCHRTILVARHLEDRGMEVRHILSDGGVERHRDTIGRLRKTLRLGGDMFRSDEEVTEDAYAIQGSRIAYRPIPDRHIVDADSKGVR